MRLLRDKRGQIRVIEAFFATVLLVSCLALIPLTSSHKDATTNLASTAQNILLSLDSNGHLASLIGSQNWVALKSSVASALPLTTWFNLTVYNQQMVPLNPYPICNAGLVSDKIVSVNYVCASQNGTFAIYILQLQLSQVGST